MGDADRRPDRQAGWCRTGPSLPPEFALAAACCRWPPSPLRDGAVAEAAQALDWPLFAQVVKRHRVQGLVWHALSSAEVVVPVETAAMFSAEAAQIARHNLQLAAECVRLHRRMAQAGIPVLFIKGVTLAKLAYGTVSLKMGWDIDILVPPAALEKSAVVLEDLGYRVVIPEGGRETLRGWHKVSKESVWSRADTGISVELHTALADHPRLIPHIDSSSSVQMVEVVKGLSLPTLARDELFAYLCVHGASSAWFRLKWIADLNALLCACEPEEVEPLYRRAVELGAGRAPALGLLLCRLLFGTDLGETLERDLRADRVTRRMLAASVSALVGKGQSAEPTEARLGTLPIHLVQFGLMPGISYRLSEAWRQLATPTDRMALPLPRSLHFLYPLVQLTRLATKGRIGR